MRRIAFFISTIGTTLVFAQTSHASELSLPLALEAATTSLQHCKDAGNKVTVSIVDLSGLVKVVLKDDETSPHTLDTSRGKAYTAVTFGPIFKEEMTSKISERILANPASAPLIYTPGVMLLGGGLLITSKDGKPLAGIGVGGAPGGLLDEACAKAGYEKIKDRLP